MFLKYCHSSCCFMWCFNMHCILSKHQKLWGDHLRSSWPTLHETAKSIKSHWTNLLIPLHPVKLHCIPWCPLIWHIPNSFDSLLDGDITLKLIHMYHATHTHISIYIYIYIINSNMRIRSFSCNLNKWIAISPLIDGQTLIKLCSTVIFIPLNSIESQYSSNKTALMEPLSYHIHPTNPH